MAPEFHDDLRRTTRQALTALAGIPAPGRATGQWNDTVGPLGLAGLVIDEESSGLGLGDEELTLVNEEIGRAIPPSPFLPTSALSATLLQHSDTAAAKGLLKQIAVSDTTCVIAIAECEGSWPVTATTPAPESRATTTEDSDTWQLTGQKPCAIGTPDAEQPTATVIVIVIVLAATADGPALFGVQANDAAFTAADNLDPSRGLSDLEFDSAPAELLCTSKATGSGLRAAHDRGLLAVAAAEQIGIARACLYTTVEYAKTRTQFGSPIGSFQAIKHRCTDVLFDVEMAAAALSDAVAGPRSPADAELAFILSTRAAIFAAESSIHIHGGIGFTWEHPAHRYLRRARVNAELFGPAVRHRDAIAESAQLNPTATRQPAPNRLGQRRRTP